MTKPYVISICHQKGGVAKTTTASAVASWLAKAGQHVLLVDLDPSANLTAGLGINPGEATHSAADFLLGNDTLMKVARPSGVPGLEIVASNKEMTKVLQFISVRPKYETLFRDNISLNGMSQYDFVVIDCPPTMSAITITALAATHLAIVPTQCEYFSIQALNSVFKVIERVRQQFNSQLNYRLLVTMFDKRGNLHQQILERVKTHYADILFDTIIGVDSKLRASQVAGIPITEFSASTRGAQQYQALMREIVTYVE